MRWFSFCTHIFSGESEIGTSETSIGDWTLKCPITDRTFKSQKRRPIWGKQRLRGRFDPCSARQLRCSAPCYGMATFSRLLKITGLFCKRASFAKEPYKTDDTLQKRRIIWRSLPIVATTYRDPVPSESIKLQILISTTTLNSGGEPMWYDCCRAVRPNYQECSHVWLTCIAKQLSQHSCTCAWGGTQKATWN